jgi:hypothetical protein
MVNFLADIFTSRGLWVGLFLVAAFLLYAGIRENLTHRKKGKTMADENDKDNGIKIDIRDSRFGDAIGRDKVTHTHYHDDHCNKVTRPE